MYRLPKLMFTTYIVLLIDPSEISSFALRQALQKLTDCHFTESNAGLRHHRR